MMAMIMTVLEKMITKYEQYFFLKKSIQVYGKFDLKICMFRPGESHGDRQYRVKSSGIRQRKRVK